ncbi:MAG: DUF882 domain-containing protein [Proteobacteria bacterium]|nr:DUF882 domain-containing protein [Pseudomonadota bacterium]
MPLRRAGAASLCALSLCLTPMGTALANETPAPQAQEATATPATPPQKAPPKKAPPQKAPPKKAPPQKAPPKKAPPKKKAPPPCSRATTPAYRQMKLNWQKMPAIPPPKWRDGYRDLTFYAINTGKRVRFFPFEADGSMAPDALEHLATAMADKKTGDTCPPHPRLLKLLYKIAVRFNARQINVISGYRTPDESKGKESHHADGSAVDFMIPGVNLPPVAQYARTLGHVGVGLYPTSGFIHLDVRETPSYFWIDPSGPGKPSCMRRVFAEQGAQADRRWRAARDEPKPSLTPRGLPRGSTQAPSPPQTARADQPASPQSP